MYSTHQEKWSRTRQGRKYAKICCKKKEKCNRADEDVPWRHTVARQSRTRQLAPPYFFIFFSLLHVFARRPTNTAAKKKNNKTKESSIHFRNLALSIWPTKWEGVLPGYCRTRCLLIFRLHWTQVSNNKNWQSFLLCFVFLITWPSPTY